MLRYVSSAAGVSSEKTQCDLDHHDLYRLSHPPPRHPFYCWGMETAGLDTISGELCELLQQQMEAVLGRKFGDFTEEELEAYRKRKRRILELRSALDVLAKPR